MWKLIFIFQEILRFIIPLFIFKYPLPATLLSMLIDVDALAAQKAHLKWRQYHTVDKLMDYWSYICIVIYSLDKPIAVYMIALFVFRSVGQFLSLTTYKTKYLIIFPQIVDLYLIAYLISPYFKFMAPYFVGSGNLYVIAVLMVIGFAKELSVHVYNLSLADFLRLKTSWKTDKPGAELGKLVKIR